MQMPRPAERGLVINVGRLEINVPRSLGYFGAVGLAVVLELIEPPLAIFVAAVPLLKMLGKTNMSRPWRFVSDVVSGAAQPVSGAEAEQTVRLRDPEEEAAEDVGTAESAERGQQIKTDRSAPRRRRTTPAPA
jgi:hypothetical protein